MARITVDDCIKFLPNRFELTLAPDPKCRYCAPGAKFPGYVDYERFCSSPLP